MKDHSDHLAQIACHDCDLLQHIPPLKEGETAYCSRCNALLYHRKRNSLDRSLALVISGCILFVIANVFPFLTLNAQGQIQDSTLISGAWAMLDSEQPLLALLIFLTTFGFPLFDLAGTLYILMMIRLNNYPWGLRWLFRFLQSARPWGMLEVLMLGVLVAAVKLGDIATIIPGIAMYAFALLILVLAALAASLDPHLIWNKVVYE